MIFHYYIFCIKNLYYDYLIYTISALLGKDIEYNIEAAIMGKRQVSQCN